MRWRKSLEDGSEPQTPQYLSKNTADVYHVEIDLWNTSYVVPQGHNLRFVVQVSLRSLEKSKKFGFEGGWVCYLCICYLWCLL